MNFFLIDDDADDRELFEITLKDVNPSCTCITAKNGEDAIRILNAQPDLIPDFIFLDLNMPLMDGRTCLIELRKLPKFQKVPIIIFTTSNHPRDIEDTKKLGASHYLIKPSSLKTLKEILSTLLQDGVFTYRLN